MNKRHVVRCECKSEALFFEYDREDSEVYVHYMKEPSRNYFLTRLKNTWKALLGKESIPVEVIMNHEELKDLNNYIDDVLENINNQNEE